MSTVRMSPELIATIQTGVILKVVEGGAPMGAKVSDVRLEHVGYEAYPLHVLVEVDDGEDGDRAVTFQTIEPEDVVGYVMDALRRAFYDGLMSHADPDGKDDEYHDLEREVARLRALL